MSVQGHNKRGETNRREGPGRDHDIVKNGKCAAQGSFVKFGDFVSFFL